jgi:aerobic carbon-monoxide dehydrogenase large subunit
MACAGDVPAIEVIEHNVPTPHTPLGSKGKGEGPTGMAPGALGNAIADALEPFGVVLRELPFSRERIWRLVAEAKAAPAPGPDGTAGMPRVVRFHSLAAPRSAA